MIGGKSAKKYKKNLEQSNELMKPMSKPYPNISRKFNFIKYKEKMYINGIKRF